MKQLILYLALILKNVPSFPSNHPLPIFLFVQNTFSVVRTEKNQTKNLRLNFCYNIVLHLVTVMYKQQYYGLLNVTQMENQSLPFFGKHCSPYREAKQIRNKDSVCSVTYCIVQ